MSEMARSIAMMIFILFVDLALTGCTVLATEVNDQHEHSHQGIDVSGLGSGSLGNRLLTAIHNTGLNDRDEDHSNIELDKINDNQRYTMTNANADGDNNSMRRQQSTSSIDTNAIDRLLGRILSRGETGRFVRSQIDRKRSSRGFNEAKEDKDYTFIVDPTNKYAVERQRIGNLASRMLRDMIMTDGEHFYRTARYNELEPSSRSFGANLFESVPAVDYYPQDQVAIQSDTSAANNVLHRQETREKRRRCKVDPNLGVKNPSFCDTDAYFGAADYSMRDVWDSAGR